MKIFSYTRLTTKHGSITTSKPPHLLGSDEISCAFWGNIAHVEHWEVGLLKNGKCKGPLEGILGVCVCGTVCPCVSWSQMMDGVCLRVQPSGLWDWTWLVSFHLSLPLYHSASLFLCFTSSGPNMSCCRCSLTPHPHPTHPTPDLFPLILPSLALWHFVVLWGKWKLKVTGHIFIKYTCLL